MKGNAKQDTKLSVDAFLQAKPDTQDSVVRRYITDMALPKDQQSDEEDSGIFPKEANIKGVIGRLPTIARKTTQVMHSGTQ